MERRVWVKGIGLDRWNGSDLEGQDGLGMILNWGTVLDLGTVLDKERVWTGDSCGLGKV